MSHFADMPQFPPLSVTIFVVKYDSEATIFASDLYDLLKDANWHVNKIERYDGPLDVAGVVTFGQNSVRAVNGAVELAADLQRMNFCGGPRPTKPTLMPWPATGADVSIIVGNKQRLGDCR
jgi:hypothetical protein